MTAFYLESHLRLVNADCIEAVSQIRDSFVDAVVTDPPYELSMERKWDTTGVSFRAETWAAILRTVKPGGHAVIFGGTRTHHHLWLAVEAAGFEIRDCLMWIYSVGFPKSKNMDGERHGWGTALKPAWEPILLCRRPLSEKTVAENVSRWGTGAINIEGCRIETAERLVGGSHSKTLKSRDDGYGMRTGGVVYRQPSGRWPANLVLDEKTAAALGENARYFYCAKASTRERGEDNTHPTVKPLALMRWLITLVTPPGGVVLDPFCGSGTTLLAARELGFAAIGVELSTEYCEIAKRRLVERVRV